MGYAIGIVITCVLFGVIRVLLGIPSNRANSKEYHDRDYP
ncbi:hypothetical protein JOC33_002369 [Thalassobacillus pellis]|nr:hypothetical protein [Thalassobacillus pellis]